MSESHAPGGTETRVRIDPAWDDRGMLDGARRRDRVALGTFFDVAFPYVFTLATRLTGDRDRAEDVAQDVFLKIYRSVDRLDPDRHPRSWVTAITCNACREAHRRERARPVRSIDRDPVSAAESPEDVMLRRERASELDRALAALDVESREVVLLRTHAGFSHDRIAEILELSHDAVRKRFSRAMQRLRELLPEVDA